MKARILRQYRTLQPGQIISAQEGDLPTGVAEYFQDDDPAIITVREPGPIPPLVGKPGEVAPLKDSDFAKSQAAKIKAVEQAHLNHVASQAAKAPGE